MIVLVLAGEAYDQPATFARALDRLAGRQLLRVTLVLHGGRLGGVDRLARMWAVMRDVRHASVHETDARPDVIVAFPGAVVPRVSPRVIYVGERNAR